MKERPILFSGPMVRAILAGTKTQTRRVVRPQPDFHSAREEWSWGNRRGVVTWTGNRPPAAAALLGLRDMSPHGSPGDRLWVRETFGLRGDARKVYYAATPELGAANIDRWRPSIHMPRWASRITLEVTGVRVERLQDISEEDARAEGAFFTDYGRQCLHGWDGPGPCPAPPEHHSQRNGWAMEATTSDAQCLGTARMAFANLWNRINGPDGWDDNPWVWVIEFRRVEAKQEAA